MVASGAGQETELPENFSKRLLLEHLNILSQKTDNICDLTNGLGNSDVLWISEPQD
jgi:hypothetical protein